MTDTNTGSGAPSVTSQCSVPVYDATGQVGVVVANGGTAASPLQPGVYGVDGDLQVVGQFDVPLTASWAASASLGNTQTLDTPGSMRAGFIQITTNIAGTGTVLVSDGVHQYRFQQSTGATTYPFDLGAAFFVAISADASIGGVNPPPPNFEQESAGAHVDFSLFESNGTTPAIPFVTPEPASAALLLLGGSICGMTGLLRTRREWGGG